MENIIYILIISLLLTLLFETAFALVAGVRNVKDIVIVLLVNIITNPVVVFSYYTVITYTDFSGVAAKAVLEAAAVATEALLYRRYAYNIKKPLLFSIGANLFSFTMGLIINILI